MNTTTAIPAPPYVIRIARRDGAATLGVLGDRTFDEANVWDAADLADRLAAAGHSELTVCFRAGDSDRWLTVDVAATTELSASAPS